MGESERMRKGDRMREREREKRRERESKGEGDEPVSDGEEKRRGRQAYCMDAASERAYYKQIYRQQAYYKHTALTAHQLTGEQKHNTHPGAT